MTLLNLIYDTDTGETTVGAASPLIAEWNHTDLTQLESAGAVDALSGTGSPTLSVVSVSERGNVLRYSPGGSSGNQEQLFLWSAASGLVIPSGDERRDVDIEIEYFTFTISDGQVGAAFGGDADNIFCHCHSGNADSAFLINNATFVTSPTVAGNQGLRRVVYHVRGRKPASAAPQWRSFAEGWDTSVSISGAGRSTGSSGTARGGMDDLGSNTTLNASWNSLDCDRLGIGMRFGTPAPTVIDILNYRVYAAA